MLDFHVQEFAEKLTKLPAKAPITEDFIAKIPDRKLPYISEQQHMIEWFLSQQTLGFGEYSRSRANNSAKVTYSRLMSAPGLLWIAEALGIDEGRCKALAATGLKVRHPAKLCGIIRRTVPWGEIAELAASVPTRAEKMDLFNNR